MKRIMISFLILIGLLAVQMKGMRAPLAAGCSMPDLCVELMGPLSFLMIVFVPILILNEGITEKSSHYQFVIRSRSWGAVLKEQLIHAALTSLMIAIMIVAVVVVYSLFNKIPFYNWNRYESIFFYKTGMRLERGGWQVALYALVCVAARCMIVQNILMVFWWGFRHKMTGVFVCLCAMFDEAVRNDKIICRLLPFNYDIWCEPSDRRRLVIQLAVYMCVFALIYKYILNRKELMRCE